MLSNSLLGYKALTYGLLPWIKTAVSGPVIKTFKSEICLCKYIQPKTCEQSKGYSEILCDVQISS